MSGNEKNIRNDLGSFLRYESKERLEELEELEYLFDNHQTIKSNLMERLEKITKEEEEEEEGYYEIKSLKERVEHLFDGKPDTPDYKLAVFLESIMNDLKLITSKINQLEEKSNPPGFSP